MVFLIDSGSDISLIPADHKTRKRPVESVLYAANSSLINAYSQRRLSLKIGLRRSVSWNFCIASVPYPIIGADLLSAHGLNIDLRNRRLIDSQDGVETICDFRVAPCCGVSVVNISTSYLKIIAEFPSITGLPQADKILSTGVMHHIITNGLPVAEKACRLSPEKLI
ncbi:uncharacterized protein LOC122503898 [Leptopilina heterotoma]|uniref:uncharacterized protein LOC122503898 n=1 Tax=Leptopilina heterotoma TaxID=63436 RepID=UPI001CA92041|nr:uncharacterized protein LOC122503898 [Leptopilina heterotoma]